jgi:hypothetical protein
MEPFIISAKLASPIVAKNLTLDGLLGAVLFHSKQFGDDYIKAQQAIPIHCDDELYSASVIHFRGPSTELPRTHSASLRATHDLNPATILNNNRGGPPTVSEKRRKQFGNVMNSYTSVWADRVFWMATGDPEHVLTLLSNTHFIGKRRASGAGSVSDWTLEPSELNGLVDASGLPTRPIPASRWDRSINSIMAEAAWKPAYWDLSNRAICAIPKSML